MPSPVAHAQQTSENPIYSSFGVFCPSAHIECVDLLDTEDVLIDWGQPMYLNFTHVAIMDRLDAFYTRNYGVMERLNGDIYVSTGVPDDLELEWYACVVWLCVRRCSLLTIFAPLPPPAPAYRPTRWRCAR